MTILTLALSPITNPALPIKFGSGGTASFTEYIVLLWQTLILLGGLAALVYMLWGAVDWILSGGDQGKVESARKKMTTAVVGLAVLAASVAIVGFVGTIVQMDLLAPAFPTAEDYGVSTPRVCDPAITDPTDPMHCSYGP